MRVKIEAFNFTLYGPMDGRVLTVTRDAVSPPAGDAKSGKPVGQNDGDAVASDGNAVNLARIALSQDWLTTEGLR